MTKSKKDEPIQETEKKMSNSKRIKKKINVSYCKDKSFEECELEIVRNAIKTTEEIKKADVITKDVKKMIQIVKDFIIQKKLICYGGTAINNILPKHAQFYDQEGEIPDYDFFSSDALNDAKELAEIYHRAGFKSVEAKSGIHFGTFKVFVEYIPMADVTQVGSGIYKTLLADSISIAGIRYCPPDYLRMNMYLELSRPAGDVSRWDKVASRLLLLNKYHPMSLDDKCGDLVKKMDTDDKKDFSKTYEILKDELINQGVVFFGDFALSLYSKFMDGDSKKIANEFKTFKIINEDPKRCVDILTDRLKREGIKNVKVVEHKEIEEMVPSALEVRINNFPRVVIYEPLACHNYNEIVVDDKTVNVATIDTLMTFYLAFYYTSNNKDYKTRIFCMATQLFELTQKRLEEEGILKRFSTTCLGDQKTLISMRAEKTQKREELKNKRGTEEFESWFLNFNPATKKGKENDNKKPVTEISEQTESVKLEESEESEKPVKPYNKKNRNTYKGKNFKKSFTRKNNLDKE